jgi:hypothetical protein
LSEPRTFSDKDLRMFDRLTLRLSSPFGHVRINARFDLTNFIDQHGREKCDAMFAVLRKRDAKKRA